MQAQEGTRELERTAERLLAEIDRLLAENQPGSARHAELDSTLERDLGLDSLGRVELLLRIEDIDFNRCRPEYATDLIDDLTWLGLVWHGEILYQSRNLAAYTQALERLKQDGLIYPCFCTRREIQREIENAGLAVVESYFQTEIIQALDFCNIVMHDSALTKAEIRLNDR